MNESMNISRRDALKTIGAACLTAAIATTPFASCVAKNEEDKKEENEWSGEKKNSKVAGEVSFKAVKIS